jgi:hypothetical protein
MALPLLIPAIQAGAGLAQSIFGGGRARKAQRELENMSLPTYTPSKSITDYYSQALSRYNTDPYSSPLYKMQQQNAQRATNQGLAALQDRRSALAGVPALVQAQQDSMLNAAGIAEQRRDQDFARLGQASGMKADEDRQAFNVNQMLPYQHRTNLLSQKAAGGAATMNAGLQNIFGGLGTMGQMKFQDYLFNKYGSNSTTI